MSEHVVPVRTYLAVFVVLLVMTATTTAVSAIDLGPWNTVAALAIAIFKASLVVLFFMHLKYGPRLTRTVLFGGLLWIIILITLTLSDFMTRARIPT